MAWYRTAARWLPLVTATAVGSVAFGFFMQLRAQEALLLERRTELQAVRLRHALHRSLEQHLLALVRLAHHWESEVPSREEWEADAALLASHEAFQAVEWADSSMRVRWVAPIEGNERARDLDLGVEPRRRAALEAARASRQPAISRTIDLVQGGKGLLMIVPLFGERGFEGYLVGALATKSVLDSIAIGPGVGEYEVSIYDGGERVHRIASQSGAGVTRSTEAVALEMNGLDWGIHVAPSIGLVRSHFSLSSLTLAFGLPAAALLGLVMDLARRARFRARQAERARAALEREITVRRAAQADLELARLELEGRVAERTASLRNVNVRLEAEVAQRRRAQEALQLMVRELDHRVKNTLAMVQAVAEQTFASSPSPETFSTSFRGRIGALARLHQAVGEEQVPLERLVELTVAPYGGGAESLRVEGGEVSLPSRIVRPLGMALHELATNAAKHGAFSRATGRVEVVARLTGEQGRRLHLEWRESGGPEVDQPSRRGMGTALVSEALAYELGGRAVCHFDREGIRWELELPLDEPSKEPHAA